MIVFERVTKVYGDNTYALDNVSLRIKKGEFIFLVGPSGAGKSTFVRLLLREDLPTKGRIMVDGVETRQLRTREVPFFRRQIGTVFQDFRLLPERTVSENVAFALQVVEAPRRETYGGCRKCCIWSGWCTNHARGRPSCPAANNSGSFSPGTGK